jgi:hypothetical protein
MSHSATQQNRKYEIHCQFPFHFGMIAGHAARVERHVLQSLSSLFFAFEHCIDAAMDVPGKVKGGQAKYDGDEVQCGHCVSLSNSSSL